MSFAKTLQPSVRCFEFSLPQFFSELFSIFLYHRTRHAVIFRSDTDKPFPHYFINVFVCSFLKFSFYFSIATIFPPHQISILLFRISYTWVLPTLNIFMICLTDNLSRLLAWITFTLVLISNTTLVFVAMMTTARLSKNVGLGLLISKISGRGKQFSWISVQVVQYR